MNGAVFGEIWQDALGILIVVGFGMFLYMKKTGKTFKEIIQDIKGLQQ